MVATELGVALAQRGYDVHFIAHRLPFRLRTFASNVFFHEASAASYPVFDQAPYNLALTTKMVEVAENYDLDLLHVPYACHSRPAPTSRASSSGRARSAWSPRSITRHHGSSGWSRLLSRDQVQHPVERRRHGVSRFLKERARGDFGITRPIA